MTAALTRVPEQVSHLLGAAGPRPDLRRGHPHRHTRRPRPVPPLLDHLEQPGDRRGDDAHLQCIVLYYFREIVFIAAMTLTVRELSSLPTMV